MDVCKVKIQNKKFKMAALATVAKGAYFRFPISIKVNVCMYVPYGLLNHSTEFNEIFRDNVALSRDGSCEVWCRSNKKQ